MKFAPEFVEQGTAFAGKGYLLIPLFGAGLGGVKLASLSCGSVPVYRPWPSSHAVQCCAPAVVVIVVLPLASVYVVAVSGSL
jgi:hypothetical protein